MTRIFEKLRIVLKSTKQKPGLNQAESSKIVDSHRASIQQPQNQISPVSHETQPVKLNWNWNWKIFSQINSPIFECLGTIIITSAGVAGLVLAVRELKWLEGWELNAYDQMMRSRPLENLDRRLVMVKVDEKDVEKYGYPLPNRTVNQLLNKIQSHKPKVIGLFIKNSPKIDVANPQNLNNVIVHCTQSSMKRQEIPAMSNFPTKNIGFNDIVADNGVVRRSLLFANPKLDKKCHTQYSFAAALAYNYLPLNIDFHVIDEKHYKLGNTSLPVLEENSGSYKELDSGGYQIMLNYRNPESLAEQITLSEVLDEKFKPSLFKDRLVIIGTVARSETRSYYTPYTASENYQPDTPSVFFHAQTASQLISAVLDKRSFIWYWSEHFERLWIWAWAGIGAALAWRLRHPAIITIAGTIITGGLVVFCYLIFLQSGWIPVVPAVISLVLSTMMAISYIAYRTQIQTRLIILQVEKQQEAIAQLNTLLKEGNSAGDSPQKLDALSNQFPATPLTFSTSFLLSGRYQITRVLGQGGFGRTYLAKDTQRPGNPTCVVKQLMPARRDTRFMQVARRLFDAEAEILEILGKHRQIPELLAFFEENQEFYLVQEFIRGNSLEKELSPTSGKHNEKFVIEMLADILEVLAYVHEHRVIHRDIKPANIIRSKQDNRLVLIDFGAVKQMQPSSNEDTELATVAIGSRGYTPPEQFAGHPRLSSDIYALGMIAIQALTGITPQQLAVNPDTGSVTWQKQASTSKELTVIIDKMVHYHFSDRYQSAREVLEDLRKI